MRRRVCACLCVFFVRLFLFACIYDVFMCVCFVVFEVNIPKMKLAKGETSAVSIHAGYNRIMYVYQ